MKPGAARGLRGRLWLRGRFRSGWLTWERGRIRELGEGAPPRRLASVVEDLGDRRILPGFCDTLVHGFAGVWAADAPAGELARMTRGLAAAGVTSLLAGTRPFAPAEAGRAARRWQAWRRLPFRERGARVAGWHMEGPFLPPSMRGALPRAALQRPSARAAAELVAACGGWLRMLTLAPELDGAAEAAAVLRSRGVLVAAGHTRAGFEACTALAAAGPLGLTHTGNRMPPLAAREPGPLGFALGGGAAWAGVIPDGMHVAPETLRILAAAPGLRRRLVAQSDNLGPAGLVAGDFLCFGRRARRDGPAARFRAGGGLCGTLDPLPELLLARVREGTLTWGQAIRMGCEVPGALLGTGGRLEPGVFADVVVVEEGRVAAVFVAGRAVG